MGDFQRDSNRGGGFRSGNGGRRPSFGGGSRGPVTMHKAVCDECHKNCEVPFHPSGDKPIYCNDCFGSKRGNDNREPRKDFGGDRGHKREFNDRPTQAIPTRPASSGLSEDMKNQFREINSKLDRLSSAIEKLALSKVTSTPASVVKPVAKKVKIKAPSKKVVAKKKK